jgi:hypothetical protein
MAIFRKIHTSFWSDPFIQDLDNDHRLFYLYLLTNERTKQCGIYEISKKQMAYELGYSIDKVSKLLAYFIKVGKILYSETTKEVALKNWMKYNGSTSPKVVSCIKSELYSVKDRVLIEYVNGMYTSSQEEQEQEEEKEEEQDKKFKKPTIDEIALYMDEQGMVNVSERFYNFYEAKDWMIGKNKMKNWRACVITWKKDNMKPVEIVKKPTKYFNVEEYDKTH